MNNRHKCKSKLDKFSYIFLVVILLGALNCAYSTYININMKDLNYSIKYNITKRFFYSNNVLGIQKISVIDKKDDYVLLKLDTLTKQKPSKSKVIVASFINKNGIWDLEYIY